MATVVVLGSGVMGSAMAMPLADNGHEVRLVGTHLDRAIVDELQATGRHPGLGRELPPGVRAFHLEEIEAGFDGAEVVVSGVNSFGVEWAGRQLAQVLRPGQHVIAVTKGVRAGGDGALRILPDVLAAEVPEALRAEVTWSAIAGPAIAGEVAARRDTCVVFCGTEQAVLDQLAGIFRTGWYHVWTSTDFAGVEICAASKNCYALSIGFGHGLLEARGEAESEDRNHNVEAALYAQAASEMRRIVELVGGRPETPGWLPGVGDMYVTSTGGRNVRVGRLIGAGKRFGEASEALGNPTLEGAAAIREFGRALARLTERGVLGPGELPLLRHLDEVVAQEAPLRVPWERFFGGEPAR
jgi:glycerol-3-phosphate dehydrogenase (NAD(P)+)